MLFHPLIERLPECVIILGFFENSCKLLKCLIFFSGNFKECFGLCNMKVTHRKNTEEDSKNREESRYGIFLSWRCLRA